MLCLQTERLVVRDFRESDYEELHAFASDPEVTRFTSFGPNSPEETRAFLHAAVSEVTGPLREQYSLAVELRGSGSLIGSCGFGKENHGQYEIGYVLSKSQWGLGLATELVNRLVTFAFRDLHAKKLWAPVDSRNVASCRVLAKAAFREEGLLRQDRLKWPEGRDTKLFGLLAEEWMAALNSSGHLTHRREFGSGENW